MKCWCGGNENLCNSSGDAATHKDHIVSQFQYSEKNNREFFVMRT